MKQLTMRDVIAQDKHEDIWVLNSTKGNRRGNVFFTVANATGTREDQVNVPSTFIPINLTNQVTREQLLGSSSFRKAVNHELLKVVDAKDAEAFMKEPDAAREWNSVRAQMIDSVAGEAAFGMDKEQPAQVQQDAVTSAGVSVPVSQFIDLMDTKKDSEALSELRNMGDLEIAEYKAILQRARGLNYEAVGKHVHGILKTANAL